MRGPVRCGLAVWLVLGSALPCTAAGLESVGNVDGVLTWQLGNLAPGSSAREAVLFTFGTSADDAARQLEAARGRFAKPSAMAAPSGAGADAGKVIRIKNEATDFALYGTGFFRFDQAGQPQMLACSHGGQLSQFTWYVHYRDGSGEHRAGTPHTGDSTPENLRVVEPVHGLRPAECAGVMETTDGKIRIAIRAVMGEGSVVAVEFALSNRHATPLADVRLSAYANIEAAHTHEGDFSFLDARTGGLLVFDPPTRMCVVMAGLDRPATGHSGTWCSLPQLQAAAGIPIEQWKPFSASAVSEEVLARARDDLLAQQGIYLPYDVEDPTTPETRTLAADEAAAVLNRDWLFQAEGKPLDRRAAEEIGWARQLAARLATNPKTPDLSAELGELRALEERLADLKGKDAIEESPAGPGVMPSWIWFPEGRAAEDAPAEARFFRCTFEMPVAGASRAELRITADDACEVFLNGRFLGNQATWQQAAAFAVGRQLKPGKNLLAVRAENKPASGKNPAGLIATLSLTLADGKRMRIVSDASWRTAKGQQPGWQQPDFDDSSWKAAAVAAPYGKGPWGHIHDELALLDPTLDYTEASPAASLYLAVRRVKRQILFKNPAVDFSRLLFIDQPYPRGRVNDTHESIHRMGITATAGGRLLVLEGLDPGGKVRLLAPREKPGSFWRPDLSFDAKRILFCYKAYDEKSFHLYEMNVDGTGVRRLTDTDYDDVDPIYLPDGHILFTTTRGNSHVRCGPFIYSYILARCDADGSNVYLISYNGEPDFVPSLLNDGRVIYSRWEYSDKPLWRLQKLWTTNQDGTGTAHFWGNQSVWPDHLSEPRPIPGSRRVMFSGVGHHDWWSGSLGIIDPDKGRDWPYGLTKVTADRPWPEVNAPPADPIEAADYHSSGPFTGYKTAYPLSEQDFLVSARGEGGKFRLYLMDVHGNRDLVYEGVHNVWHAIPLAPRPVPPQHADRVVWPGTGKDRKPVQSGVFYSADVYQGVRGLPPGMAKYLRVFQLDYKTYSTWKKTYRHSGPAVSIVQEEGVKRILSEVPVESDGSVCFKAPAGRAVFFQLLDSQGRCLQTMRSFTGLMPGERRGCLGCHEGHSSASTPRGGLALRRPPTQLSPPTWGTESIGYERFVQPVLDRYCVNCHQGKPPGPDGPDLRLRPGHGPFKEPYLTLVGAAAWGYSAPASGPGYGIAGAIPVESAQSTVDPKGLTTLPPMQYLSSKSRLVDLAASGKHHDVKVDAESLRRLIAWVDSCCVYRGEPEVRALGDPDFPGIDRLPIRPRVATAPVIERP